MRFYESAEGEEIAEGLVVGQASAETLDMRRGVAGSVGIGRGGSVAMRQGFGWLMAAIAVSLVGAGCFHHPKVNGDDLLCMNDDGCMAGYVCTKRPGDVTQAFGHCVKPDAATSGALDGALAEAGGGEAGASVEGGAVGDSQGVPDGGAGGVDGVAVDGSADVLDRKDGAGDGLSPAFLDGSADHTTGDAPAPTGDGPLEMPLSQPDAPVTDTPSTGNGDAGGASGGGGGGGNGGNVGGAGAGGTIALGGTSGNGSGGAVGNGGGSGLGGVVGAGGDVGAGGAGTGGSSSSGGTIGSGGSGTGGASGSGGTKGNGLQCLLGTECTSGNCADGVCCDQPCGGCYACLASMTGSQTGQCMPATAGMNPHSTCTVDNPPCGHDGTCDGAGACRFRPANTSCGNETCSGATYTPPAYCTGNGTCGSVASTACANGLSCGSSQCKTSCSTNSDCASGYACPSVGSTSCTRQGVWTDAKARVATGPYGPQVTPTGPCTPGDTVIITLASADPGYQYGWELDTSPEGDWCRSAQLPYYYCNTKIRVCGTTSPTWDVYWRTCTCIAASGASYIWTSAGYNIENACTNTPEPGWIIGHEYDCN
jgi:hypothetical protein